MPSLHEAELEGDVVVDVIIPVHSAARPVGRAVESVLEHNHSSVRAVVVIHNTDPAPIMAQLKRWEHDERLWVARLDDGVPSPAGPMNLGIELSRAEFLSFLGSDDTLAPGALDAWVGIQRESDAEVVIAPMRDERGTMMPTPPVRPMRWRRLNLEADRLAYRSAPLGLVSRRKFADLRFSIGLKSGEDVLYTMRLWTSNASIVFTPTTPAYVVHDDAADRVTFAPRLIQEDFAFLDAVLSDTGFHALARSKRTAFGVKLLRAHLFDAVRNREESEWLSGQRQELAKCAERIVGWAPEAVSLLSLKERRLLRAVRECSGGATELAKLSRDRRRYFSLGAVLTKSPFRVLHRQGPLRFGVATIFLSYR